MAVVDKFEDMLHIDESAWLDAGARALATRQRIEAVADAAVARGVRSLIYVGSGGTYASSWPYQALVRCHSDLPVHVIEAAELGLVGERDLGPSALVVVTSVTGTTEDVLAALDHVRRAGARIVAFVPLPTSPVALAADDFIETIAEWRGWDLYLLLLTTRLLHARNEYPDYESLVASLQHVPAALLDVARRADPAAVSFANSHATGDYVFLVGSGNLWGFTYTYSMCVLEEMLWMRTTRVTAAEFFHGSLELIERDTPILILQGEDATRPLTERVIRFAKRVSDDVTVLDTKSFALTGIDRRFRDLVGPSVMLTAARRLTVHLQKSRDHDLDTRRYYRVVEY